MRILHTADWHIDEYPGRVQDGENLRRLNIALIINHIVDCAIAQRVQLFLFAGDAFKTKRPPYRDILVVAEAFRRLTEAGIPVVAIPGNHDLPNDGRPGAFEVIEAMRIPGVKIMTRPGIARAVVPGEEIQVACLPSASKSQLLSKDEYKDLGPEQAHQVMSDKLRQIVYGLAAELDPGTPSVLLPHFTTVGCQYDSGEHVFLAQEPVLSRDLFEPFDLVTLGHIHRAQQIEGTSAYYCGSPERINFNEEHQQKGFYLHRFDQSTREFESRFVETPARQFLTITKELTSVEDLEPWYNELAGKVGEKYLLLPETAGAIVRVRYTAPADVAKAVNHRRITDELMKSAFWVAGIEALVDRSNRARDEEVTEAMGVTEALTKYLERNEIEDDGLTELAGELLADIGLAAAHNAREEVA